MFNQQQNNPNILLDPLDPYFMKHEKSTTICKLNQITTDSQIQNLFLYNSDLIKLQQWTDLYTIYGALYLQAQSLYPEICKNQQPISQYPTLQQVHEQGYKILSENASNQQLFTISVTFSQSTGIGLNIIEIWKQSEGQTRSFNTRQLIHFSILLVQSQTYGSYVVLSSLNKFNGFGQLLRLNIPKMVIKPPIAQPMPIIKQKAPKTPIILGPKQTLDISHGQEVDKGKVQVDKDDDEDENIEITTIKPPQRSSIAVQPQPVPNSQIRMTIANEQCIICYGEYNQSFNSIDLGCHKVHDYCIIQNCKAKILSEQISTHFACPICNKAFSRSLVISWLSQVERLKLMMHEIKSRAMMECFKCSNPINFMRASKIPGDTALPITCASCNVNICSKCRCEFHGVKPCPGIKKQIIQFLQDQKAPIIVCPFCEEVQTKDENCDHVTCKCGQELCGFCSVARGPTMAHGNHYHRVGCRHYQPWINPKTNKEGIDQQQNDCTECKKSKGLNACSKPLSFEEYRKQAGY